MRKPMRYRVSSRNWDTERGLVAFSDICAAYGDVCLSCLCRSDDRRLTIDHVVPIARGGRNSVFNVQPLCSPCNGVKAASGEDHREFLAQKYPDKYPSPSDRGRWLSWVLAHAGSRIYSGGRWVAPATEGER